MRLVVLDTDVFSFFFKHDTRAALYAPDLAGGRPCLQSLAEPELWAITRRWGERRRRRLTEVAGHYLLFPPDEAMVRLWAQETSDYEDIPGLNVVTHRP